MAKAEKKVVYTVKSLQVKDGSVSASDGTLYTIKDGSFTVAEEHVAEFGDTTRFQVSVKEA